MDQSFILDSKQMDTAMIIIHLQSYGLSRWQHGHWKRSMRHVVAAIAVVVTETTIEDSTEDTEKTQAHGSVFERQQIPPLA